MAEIELIHTEFDPVTLIEQADLQPSTRDKYIRALRGYLAAGHRLGDVEALASYAAGLSRSGKAFLKAAVALWAGRMAVIVKGQATPENVDAVQATLHRLEALKTVILVKASKGQKAHTWLSQQQVKQLSNAVGNSIVGARDRVALGLLVAAGLRREEAVSITFDDVLLKPVGEKMRTVLAVKGKGAKNREVPISDGFAADLDTWGKYIGHLGLILRSLGRNREPEESISAVALFKLVRKYGARIGKPDLAPHDLRRTYAQLGYEAGIPITQITTLLGHESVATTQRYLNLDLDLEVTASDFIPW